MPTLLPSEHGPVRIVLADDHPLYREALKRMLGQESDLQVIAEAADGRQALEVCRLRQPELVLMDVRMPTMDGIAATRAIKRESPRTVVLVLSAMEEPTLLAEALKAGAAGYVLKHATAQQLIEAIRKALSGELPMDQALAGRLLRELLAQKKTQQAQGSASLAPPAGRPLPASLTVREGEILKLVARGKTNQEIARSLHIGVSTVKKHVHRIITKLGVSDRTQAAVRAIELGFPLDRGGGGNHLY